MLTQDEYTLWTGEPVNYDSEDWETITAVASGRLASFLCLDNLPADAEGELPDDLKELLSSFIWAVRDTSGRNEKVESKSIRNFTIKFASNSAANAFADIASDFGDIIEKYSNCGTGVDAERSTRYCCGRF